jgi:hypothetical protein
MTEEGTFAEVSIKLFPLGGVIMSMPEHMVLSLISELAGVVLTILGTILMVKQRFIEKDGIIKVEIPLFGRLSSNYPAALSVFIGAFLIWYPLHNCFKVTEQIPIVGKIEREGQLTHEGTTVVVYRNDNKTSTNSDGTFTLKVPRDGLYYEGLAYYTASGKTLTYMAGVSMADDRSKGNFEAQLK